MTSFPQQLAHALDTEDVQAKILKVAVEPVFKLAFDDFCQAMGSKVGDMLVDDKVSFERTLLNLKDSIATDIEKVTPAGKEMGKEIGTSSERALSGEAAIVGTLAAARRTVTKSSKRRACRKRCATAFMYARELLLQHRSE